MNVQSFHLSMLMRFFINISILQFSVIIPFAYCAPGDRTCPGSLYNCGRLQGIGYPFWGGNRPEECGIRELLLQCVENQKTINMINNIQKFLVLGIDKSLYQMTVVRYDLWENFCLTSFTNTTSIPSVLPSLFGSIILNIFYGCPIATEITRNPRIQSSNVTCTIDGRSSGVRFALASEYKDSVEGCKISIGVPVLNSSYDKLIAGLMTLQEAVSLGFIVDYIAQLQRLVQRVRIQEEVADLFGVMIIKCGASVKVQLPILDSARKVSVTFRFKIQIIAVLA
ncbi:hypothetical protein ACH5RR_009012 [Cinchona calisaya]|uniref:Wall-associated receptor kinase galacturonan-binding domain-containing protein n=1 Tax=Cinchona calisaya TaxID=153742 RepID=A0ABD3AGL2_9GENT